MAADEEQLILRTILLDDLSDPANRVTRSLDDLTDSADDNEQSTRRMNAAHDDATQVIIREDDATTRLIRTRRRSTRTTDRDTETTRRNTRERTKQDKALGQNIKKLTKANKLFKGFGLLGAGVMGGIILDVIRQAVTLINALAAGAFAFVSALAPITGILLPLPGILGALLQGFIGAKIGLGSVFSAAAEYDPMNIKAFNDALKDMGPVARGAAKQLALIKEAWKPIKRDIMEKMWEGLGAQISTLSKNYFPILRTALTQTSKHVNGIMKDVIAYMNMPGTKSTVTRIMAANNEMIRIIGTAATPLVRGLLDLMDATSSVGIEMVQGMADGITKMADRISENKDRIAAFAKKGLDVFRKLWKAVKDFSMALFNIGKIAGVLGGEMLGSFGAMMERFRAWTESAEGQQKITAFFDEMRPVLKKLGELMGALGDTWAKMSHNGPHLIRVMDGLIDLLPAFAELVNKSGEYILAFLELGGAILGILAGLNLISPIVIILRAIAIPLAIIATALNALPEPVQTVIGLFLMLALTLKILLGGGIIATLLQKIPLIGKMFTGLIGILRGLMAAFALGGFKALGAAILGLMGPVGWIIAAVIAIGVALVMLYRKNEAFRNWVNKQWQAIKSVWVDKIYPTLQRAWTVIKETWDKIWRGIRPYLVNLRTFIIETWTQHIYPAMQAAWGVVQKTWDKIMQVLRPVFDWMKQFWEEHGDKVMTVLKVIGALVGGVLFVAFLALMGAIGAVLLAIRGLANGFRWIFESVIPAVWGLWTWLWDNIIVRSWNAIQGVIGGVRTIWGIFWMIFTNIWNYIKMWWNTMTNLFWMGVGVIGGAFSTVWRTVGGVFANIWGIISGVWIAITSAFADAWNTMRTTLRNGGGFFMAIFNGIKAFWSGLWNGLTNVVFRVWQRMNMIWIGLKMGVIGVLQTIRDKWNEIWGGIRDFVQPILDRINEIIDGALSKLDGLREGWHRMWDWLPWSGRAMGGPVASGATHLVGEIGPEAYVSSTGTIKPIGMHGPEVMKFPSSGFVVPNHVLGGVRDPSVPDNVMRRLEGALAGSGDQGYATGGYQKSGSGSTQTYMQDGDGMPSSVTVQVMGNVTSDVDLERAVMDGIKKYNRLRRERR